MGLANNNNRWWVGPLAPLNESKWGLFLEAFELVLTSAAMAQPSLWLCQLPLQSTPFSVLLPKQTWHLLTSGEMAAIDVSFLVKGLDGYATSLSFAAEATASGAAIVSSSHVCVRCSLLCYFPHNWSRKLMHQMHTIGLTTALIHQWRCAWCRADGERELASRLFSISQWNVQHGSCSAAFSFYSPSDSAK